MKEAETRREPRTKEEQREHYARRVRHEAESLPPIGSPAPEFSLPQMSDPTETVQLSSLRGKPVALIFGSYTCGPFRKHVSNLNRLYARYRDKVHFLFVYTREAHPAGSSEHVDNKVGAVPQPSTLAERLGNARACSIEDRIEMPIVLDTMDDAVSKAYASMPDRLYFIDEEGRLEYRSGFGPRGFRTPELDRTIRHHFNAIEA